MNFRFSGTIPASKSILNRALVIQSFAAGIKIAGESEANDVALMRQALFNLGQESIECGDAGTVLRFMALRVSRLSGVHMLTGSERLFSRPQGELIPILSQLGVDAELKPNCLKIRSQGWRLAVDGLHIHAERSSQFASAVFLSAWGLPFALPISISKKMVSESYFRMTIQMVRDFGMRVQGRGPEYVIPSGQQIHWEKPYTVEPDLSSAFSVAALAAVAGHAEIRGFPRRSLQPDAIFVKLLSEMGVSLKHENDTLIIEKSKLERGVTVDLTNSPDLFPVLAVLCALAESKSEVSGVDHLRFKESSRLERARELIEWMGARVEVDGTNECRVTIYPTRTRPVSETVWAFDPDRDHRMAMAAEVARWAGFPIQVKDMKVVSKSFPEFVQITGQQSASVRGGR